MRVIAGTSIRGDGQFFQLKSYIVHPDYAIRSPFDADIGLVELLQPLTWSDAVQPAPINAFGNELPDDSAVQVVGWGDTVGETMGENYADILQEVTLYTVSNAECKKAYEDEDIVTENMLCAGSRGVGDVDACEGDSGGPMYFRNQNDIDILVGVVSFGPYPCANPLKPGGFTKVSAYTDWILRNAV
ncbi:hypothetical protein JYU34_022275 [Plutella xylostella]|uniref:Peptidase S1 domain-containing protein n=2 Tax=Plutella xylostella TaxID=51655 RepID=A0ABQ7PQM7_PLUXY|nr:hypothetical protein JYU34_022275 [Plutella xylostella]